MDLPSRQQQRVFRSVLAALAPRALAALLLGALPGALLICIFHCTWPSYAGLQRPGVFPFLCHELPEPGADLPLPVSGSIVQSLVQSVTTALALVVLLIVMLRLLVVMPAFAARLADAPPAPPPRT